MGYTNVPPKTRVAVPVRRNMQEMPTTHVDVTKQNADAGAQAARMLNNFPLVGAVLIPNIRFVVGTNTYVQHGLNRVPNGYILANVRPDPTQAAATGTPGCQRNTTSDPNNNQTFLLSLGPFQPFIADILVWGISFLVATAYLLDSRCDLF